MSHRQRPFSRSRSVVGAMLVLAGTMTWPCIADAQLLASPQNACRLKNIRRQDALVQVPFELIDGRIYVQTEVNGRHSTRFAVDTGASGSARADASLVRVLGLAVRGQVRNSDGVQTTQTNTVHMDSIRLDGLQRQNIEAITRDYNSQQAPYENFAGILARDFFADGLLVVNYVNRTLSFTRSETLDSKDRNVLTYERAFRVPVLIGNLQVQGNLDTGANVALVLPREIYKKISSAPVMANETAQLSNGVIETGRKVIPGPVSIGELSLSNIEARVSARYPEVLVGTYALQASVLMIDQRSHTIAICR